MRPSITHHPATRTTSLLERLFGEERRGTKSFPHAFTERAVLKLMHPVLVRAGDSWRGVKITKFDSRPLQALREHAERITIERNSPAMAAEIGTRPAEASSIQWT